MQLDNKLGSLVVDAGSMPAAPRTSVAEASVRTSCTRRICSITSASVRASPSRCGVFISLRACVSSFRACLQTYKSQRILHWEFWQTLDTIRPLTKPTNPHHSACGVLWALFLYKQLSLTTNFQKENNSSQPVLRSTPHTQKTRRGQVKNGV